MEVEEQKKAAEPGEVSGVRQTAVAPLNTIGKEDVAAAGAALDAWLRQISGGYVTLGRVCTVAGSLPVVGNVMALVDAILDVVHVVEARRAGKEVEFLDWVSLGVNLIGVIPLPPAMAPARMTLRPALHLLKQRFQQELLQAGKTLAKSGAQQIGDALIEVLTGMLNDRIAGEVEQFAQTAQDKLGEALEACAKKSDEMIDDLIDVIRRLSGQKGLFDVPAPAAEKSLHDPKTQSTWAKMLAAVDKLQKETANTVAKAAASQLPKGAQAVVNEVIAKLEASKLAFRAQLQALGSEATALAIGWMLKALIQALSRRRAAGRSVVVPANKGAQDSKTKPAGATEALAHQSDATKPPRGCKNCPAPPGTKNSISYATGAESFTHTDFVLEAPLPIAWQRTYCSDLRAYDEGSLGARWQTPYGMRVDVVESPAGVRGLRYHGADGRSHDYPWLEVGQCYRDRIEEVTLTRLAQDLLTLDFGKPVAPGEASEWRESYELVSTCASKQASQGQAHFRLVALQARDGAAIGLRYDHVVGQGPNTGEAVLSDILSRQGEEVVAHVGTQLDARSGLIQGLWEIREGRLVRQLAAYTHDERGDLVQAQDENAAVWHYTYGDGHLVTRYTDRTGRGVNLSYEEHKGKVRAVREWADDGSRDTRLRWDPNIRLVYETNALGGTTWTYYDMLGYTYRVIHPDGREEWLFRDEAKNVTRHIHPDGSVDHYAYDEDGNLQWHERADGSRVHFEYDQSNRLTGLLDAQGGVWRREYDPQGHLVAQTDPRGHRTAFEYDKAGRVVRVTDAKGGVKVLGYTRSGQLESYTDCSGRTSRWQHDERGRVRRHIDAQGNETAYGYTAVTQEALDELARYGTNHPGQLEVIEHPDGTQEQFVHDAEGRLLSHTDALERRTRYSYDAAGQLVQRRDALGHTLSYRWDALGRLAALRNENERSHEFAYDPVGRLLSEREFDGTLTRYRYNEASGVLSEVLEGADPDQGEGAEPRRVTTLVFDPLGRLLSREARSGDQVNRERFAYDGEGRLVQASNEEAQLQWYHDEMGNVVREHHHDLKRNSTAVWLHGYDELGAKVSTVRPDGHTVQWLRYGAGHVHGLLLDGREVLGIERDELHQEIERSQGNGLTQRQQYDRMGRLQRQWLASSALGEDVGPVSTVHGRFRYLGPQKGPRLAAQEMAAIARFYEYDRAGQLTHISDSRRGGLEYAYDPVGRLLKAQHNGVGTERFAFDPAGNIEVPREAGATSSRKPNPVLDNLLKEYAGTSYRWDAFGNLAESRRGGACTTLHWDGFNRLEAVETEWGVARFRYDPLGRRIEKRYEARRQPTSWEGPKDSETVYGWEGDTLAYESTWRQKQARTVHYIHEPEGFVPLVQAQREGEIRLKTRTDVKALVAANGGEYDALKDPLWSEPLPDAAPFEAWELAYYQCDHLGTPQELTDHEGKVAWAAQHKAWGLAKVAISDAARRAGINTPIRFQGQYFDEETGLHYNRYRYYDPHSGRFISKDPIGLVGGINVWQYAPNSILWIDPLGLAKKCPADRTCEELYRDIMKNSIGTKETQGARGALERIEHLNEDSGDLYRRAPALEDGRSMKGKGGSLDGMGSFEGHQMAAQTTLDSLKSEILAYDTKGCGASYKKIPQKVRDIARMSVPSKPARG